MFRRCIYDASRCYQTQLLGGMFKRLADVKLKHLGRYFYDALHILNNISADLLTMLLQQGFTAHFPIRKVHDPATHGQFMQQQSGWLDNLGAADCKAVEKKSVDTTINLPFPP